MEKGTEGKGKGREREERNKIKGEICVISFRGIDTLVTSQKGLPACRQSPSQVVTGPSVEQLVSSRLAH